MASSLLLLSLPPGSKQHWDGKQTSCVLTNLTSPLPTTSFSRACVRVCSGGATVASLSTDKDMQVFPEQSQVADALANLTMQSAERAISERGSFTVALAGGSLIKLLGCLKGKSDIDWKNWHVFWVDERCVPHE